MKARQQNYTWDDWGVRSLDKRSNSLNKSRRSLDDAFSQAFFNIFAIFDKNVCSTMPILFGFVSYSFVN